MRKRGRGCQHGDTGHAGAGVSAGRAESRCPSSQALTGHTAASPVPEGLSRESPSAPTPPMVCNAPNLNQKRFVPEGEEALQERAGAGPASGLGTLFR